MRLDSRPVHLLIFCLALVPAFLTIWLILNYGVDVPYWDDWETAVLIEKFSQGTLTTADLFAKHNEYIQFFPNLFLVLLGWMTRWDLRYPMLVSFLMVCLVSYNLYRLAQLTTVGSKSRNLFQFFLSNLLIFTPMQYENWLMGIQVVYYVPIVCITTCLRIACSRLSEAVKFILCACLATISTFSSVNGILCWVVVLPVLVRWQSRTKPLGKDWIVLAWVGAFAISAVLYAYGDEKIFLSPVFSDQPLVQLGRALVYFTAFLGGPLAIGPYPLFIAVPAGAALVLLFVLSWTFYFKRASDSVLTRRLIVWLMIGTYSVLTAAMVTVGRMHLGVEQSLSSRYTAFSLYLMVSLVYLVPIILDELASTFKSRQRKVLTRLATLPAILLVVTHLAAFPMAIQHAIKPTFDRRLQAKACLLLINFVADDCGGLLYPNVEPLRQRANALDRLGFLRPPLLKSNTVEEIENAEAENPETAGSFDNLDDIGENKRVASGWASLEGQRPPNAIILAYENADADFIVFASADVEVENRSTAELLHPVKGSRWHWRKEFGLSRLPTIPTKLKAWAIDARTGRAYKLAGEKTIE